MRPCGDFFQSPQASEHLSQTTYEILTATIKQTNFIHQMYLLMCANLKKLRTTVLDGTGGDQLA